ncbi:MAG: 4-hydroxy-3-methylbut-2-enyl diphosphate reductase [Crocinitomicaceae bacterium]|nr:4-hydroxy-3-methylbut-2-enyl diphosphate reductase [Flavobacteriales bacterium]NQZ35467.1 4-hydroxy-3-methylbut-2-enyl diphosphate reductase [Crocinitomicaceae bacterium]
MKKFDIPLHYISPIISKVKAKRQLEDPRKKDFSPTHLNFGNVTFIISRHFGFCYGVENAIEKSFKAIQENPDKRIFLLSQMIHNPDVNDDLLSQGLRFIQDTDGSQLIPWDEIHPEDIVIIPAFGTTVEIHDLLKSKGIDTIKYNTTCPFVEKVWNRSAKLGELKHTVIIHGKHEHEETKATFSHSKENAPSLVVKDIKEAEYLADYILGKVSTEEFMSFFEGKLSTGFDPVKDLNRIGVVNQTTMLATDTQSITDFLRKTMIQKYGEASIKEHISDNRDTLCYATNDNQSATLELLKSTADLAIVIGGYNSSNTSHLVELLEPNYPTYFIKNKNEILSLDSIQSFDIHTKSINKKTNFLPKKEHTHIIITSGASCPDVAVDEVIQRILELKKAPISIDQIEL